MADTEVLHILKDIADDCFYRKSCGGCKFDRNGECILKGLPSDWDIEAISGEEAESGAEG